MMRVVYDDRNLKKFGFRFVEKEERFYNIINSANQVVFEAIKTPQAIFVMSSKTVECATEELLFTIEEEKLVAICYYREQDTLKSEKIYVG